MLKIKGRLHGDPGTDLSPRDAPSMLTGYVTRDMLRCTDPSFSTNLGRRLASRWAELEFPTCGSDIRPSLA
jgi:hypothetical protein